MESIQKHDILEAYFLDVYVDHTRFTIKDLAVLDKKQYILHVELSPKLSMMGRTKITYVNPNYNYFLNENIITS